MEPYNTQHWVIDHLSTWTYSLAIGSDDYARIAYQTHEFVYSPDNEYHFGVLGFIQCLDVDCAGSTNNPFVDYTAEDMFASVAVGSDGTAYVVYDNGNAEDGPQGIGLATCSGGSCSTSTLVGGISVFDQTIATIAIGSDGNPVVAYSDAQFSSDGYFTYLSSTGHYYANGTDTVVTSGASVTDLAFGPDGFAWIYVQNQAFWDPNATAGAVLLKCNNASCGSAAVNAIWVPGASSVSYGSIEVTAYGPPHAEVDTGGGSSYYIECTAADCSTYDSTLISSDSAGVASIAADQNGVPVMIAQSRNTGVVYQVRPVVSAVISQRTSVAQTVSGDDAKRDTYKGHTGTLNLGNFANNTYMGCGIGIETVATISPSSYTGHVIIHRTFVSDGAYENSTELVDEEKPPNSNDTSDASWQDQDPQSGGSGGKVYDLDTPGVHPPDGNTYRLRDNFYVYAALADGTRISSNYYFYVDVSCTKTSSGGYQFVSDASGDNQTGTPSAATTWNLQ